MKDQKLSIAVTILVPVILLSLLTWQFFFETGDTLTAPETTLVVGIYLIIILTARWLWSRLPHKRGKP
ncbi:hypothetical protein NNRS527_02196 [Nitrosospira sp. NRS527]|nr:hypothetical protein NNRS527_02196 [Nitrosospira sp. NRS527]